MLSDCLIVNASSVKVGCFLVGCCASGECDCLRLEGGGSIVGAWAASGEAGGQCIGVGRGSGTGTGRGRRSAGTAGTSTRGSWGAGRGRTERGEVVLGVPFDITASM